MTRSGLFLYDLLKGTHVRKTIGFLDQSQRWSREELEAFQEEKLKKLLEGAISNVPLYRSPATGYRLPENMTIERFDDWPIVDRAIVMEAGNALLSDNINLKKCKVSRTGGTTGPPLRLYKDTEERSWSLAAFYRFYSWMGIEPGMPEAELWGSTGVSALSTEERRTKNEERTLIQNLKFKTQHFSRYLVSGIRDQLISSINNFHSYNAFSFNDAYLEETVNKLQKFQPKLIRGYLSAILLLADYIKRNNIKGIQPIAVSSTSESLFPEYRKLIEEVFQAPLFNQYGCGECNSIAFECKKHDGMHISMEHCILESDKENNLIVTNLDNHSQPFIRYKNGDLGIIDNSLCSCGNASPRLMELQGRANENIILKDGSSVNGIFFANLLDEIGFINNSKMLRFQIVQNKTGEIEFKAEIKMAKGQRLTANGSVGIKNTDIKKLEDCLMPFFNKVVISQHQFLDSGSSGKFKYLISNI
jgi:phenylacetate-CoA ligase